MDALESPVTHTAPQGPISAPELTGAVEWLNVAAPVSLADLRGKVVLIDFWTYGCVNCMHVLRDLKALEERFPHELIIIGVHSPKFTNERSSDNLRRILVRYEIEHPVAAQEARERQRASVERLRHAVHGRLGSGPRNRCHRASRLSSAARMADSLADRLLRGDKRALARGISLVEDDDPQLIEHDRRGNGEHRPVASRRIGDAGNRLVAVDLDRLRIHRKDVTLESEPPEIGDQPTADLAPVRRRADDRDRAGRELAGNDSRSGCQRDMVHSQFSSI